MGNNHKRYKIGPQIKVYVYIHLLSISFVNCVDITIRLAFVTICYMWLHLGPLYTRSQGQCWTQIQRSY
jgi:hypothetical protein